MTTAPTTPNPTAMVNPNAASLAAFAKSAAGPIAMLNLLRYRRNEGRSEQGRAIYGRYAGVAVRSIMAVGGGLLYVGQVSTPELWDSVAIVYYPSPQAYIDMQGDQSYQDAIPDRTAGLAARMLYPFELLAGDAQDLASPIECGSAETMAIQLARLPNSANQFDSDDLLTQPDVALLAKSVGVGLVSDARWDELRLVRCSTERSGPTPPIGAEASELVFSQPVVQS